MPKPLKPHEKEYQIYALIDPRNNSIRYVGMSADTNYRFYLHIQQGGGKQESAWIRELRQLNLSPMLKVLETVDPNDYSTACEREKYWMQRLQDAGRGNQKLMGKRMHKCQGTDVVCFVRWLPL